VLRLTGDYPAAAEALGQAVEIYRQFGDRTGQGMALNEKGTLHRITGELALAEGCHQQALEMARAINSSWEQAHALAGLGRCAVAVARIAEGEASLRQALAIFRQIGSPEAAGVAAELDALARQGPGRGRAWPP
jgi:tetratricopeptide (TPR) repeat protein